MWVLVLVLVGVHLQKCDLHSLITRYEVPGTK